jgi:hypothetical protein
VANSIPDSVLRGTLQHDNAKQSFGAADSAQADKTAGAAQTSAAIEWQVVAIDGNADDRNTTNSSARAYARRETCLTFIASAQSVIRPTPQPTRRPDGAALPPSANKHQREHYTYQSQRAWLGHAGRLVQT